MPGTSRGRPGDFKYILLVLITSPACLLSGNNTVHWIPGTSSLSFGSGVQATGRTDRKCDFGPFLPSFLPYFLSKGTYLINVGLTNVPRESILRRSCSLTQVLSEYSPNPDHLLDTGRVYMPGTTIVCRGRPGDVPGPTGILV
jgi:hypothetical protein